MIISKSQLNIFDEKEFFYQMKLILIFFLISVLSSCQGQERPHKPDPAEQARTRDSIRKYYATVSFTKELDYAGYKIPLRMRQHFSRGDGAFFHWEDPAATGEKKLTVEQISPTALEYTLFYDHKAHAYTTKSGKNNTTVTSKLEFYDQKGSVIKSIDLIRSNPFTRDKYPNIVEHHYYEPEMGFADKALRDEAARTGKADKYWVSSGIQPGTRDNGYIAIDYSLTGLHREGGVVLIRDIYIIYNPQGEEIFRKTYTNDLPGFFLVTSDGSYVVINEGGGEDINNMADVISPESLAIYEAGSGKEVCRVKGINENVTFNGAFKLDDEVIILTGKDQGVPAESYFQELYLIDINNRTYFYNHTITKIEWQIADEFMRINQQFTSAYLLQNFKFESTKF